MSLKEIAVINAAQHKPPVGAQDAASEKAVYEQAVDGDVFAQALYALEKKRALIDAAIEALRKVAGV